MVLIALVLAVGIGAVIWQGDNLRALFTARTKSAETIIAEAEQSKREQQAAFAARGLNITPPSLEEIDRLIDAAAKGEEVSLVQPTESPQPTPSEGTEPAQPTEQELIQTAANALYACEGEFLGRLGAMKAEAVAQYRALPKAERTDAAKSSILFGVLAEVRTMESEADGRVQSILDDLRAQLRNIGGDVSVADELWSYYLSEKVNAKAYFVNQYL